MFYGAVVFDPWLIVAQIVFLQCLYYLSVGVFLEIFVGTRVSRMSLVYFFDYATITASTVTGWCVIVSFILSSLAGAGILVFLVERSKKCLDFTGTLYIIHIFICVIYGGWPSSITWWVVNVTGLAIMALLGEYLCIRRELREIPITRCLKETELTEEENSKSIVLVIAHTLHCSSYSSWEAVLYFVKKILKPLLRGFVSRLKSITSKSGQI